MSLEKDSIAVFTPRFLSEIAPYLISFIVSVKIGDCAKCDVQNEETKWPTTDAFSFYV